MDTKLKKLQESKEYKELVSIRSRSKWTLAVAMWLIYYGFILVIAFSPELFAQSFSGGHTSWGIVVGLGVIFSTFIITGIYVHKANEVLEPLTEKIHKKAGKLK